MRKTESTHSRQTITSTQEFRYAFLATAVPLALPAIIEFFVSFVPNAMDWTALFVTPVVDLCLIVLAGIVAGFLALAGCTRQAKGVIAGAGLGLLAMGLVIGLIILIQP
jgi:hypothetical protein